MTICTVQPRCALFIYNHDSGYEYLINLRDCLPMTEINIGFPFIFQSILPDAVLKYHWNFDQSSPNLFVGEHGGNRRPFWCFWLQLVI